jgi:Tfp pilus assembly protein FimT
MKLLNYLKSFSLIEWVVILAILALLTAVALPFFGQHR